MKVGGRGNVILQRYGGGRKHELGGGKRGRDGDNCSLNRPLTYFPALFGNSFGTVL